MECPYCGEQQPIGLSKGVMIRLFDTRLLGREYRKALKGLYHTWTCKGCRNKFIRSNVLCECKDGKGIVVKSEKAKPVFLCSKCREVRAYTK